VLVHRIRRHGFGVFFATAGAQSNSNMHCAREALPRASRSISIESEERGAWTAEVEDVEFAVGRPKGGRHRDVTSKQLKDVICGLFGYVVNIRGESGYLPATACREADCDGYLEWSINERRVKGYPLQCASSAQRSDASASNIFVLDLSWFKPMLDSLPTEPESELKKRRAARCLDYQVVESIPAKLGAERTAAAKKASTESHCWPGKSS